MDNQAQYEAAREAARRLSVVPYVVRDIVPDTLAKVFQAYSETGRLVVWAGASDKTVFGCPALNWAFRAWHDSVHMAVMGEFTRQGETLVALEQIVQARRVLDSPDADKTLWQEVIGQLDYLDKWGHFPEDQVAFHEGRE